MIWACLLIGLIMGIFIGACIMYYKDQKFLNNQHILFNELKTSKTKLDEYQKTLSDHFMNSIDLLNKMAENYQKLYKNISKNANLFLPNFKIKNNLHNFEKMKKDNEFKNKKLSETNQFSIKTPKDYFDNSDK